MNRYDRSDSLGHLGKLELWWEGMSLVGLLAKFTDLEETRNLTERIGV